MKSVCIIFIFMLCSLIIHAQVPAGFNYQAVVRSDDGEILADQQVKLKFSILRDSQTGTAIYVETQSATTNPFGLVNLTIGSGTAISGIFDPGGWGMHKHFLKVEIDPSGGDSFEHLGTSKLQSVPYAFHAQTVEEDEVEDADADPKNEIQKLTLNGNELMLSEEGGIVELPSSVAGDNWGTQTVVTDETLTGLGIETNPLQIKNAGVTSAKILDKSILTHDIADFQITAEKINSGAVTGIKIAQSGANPGQVLKWNGSSWSPANDSLGNLTLPYYGGTSENKRAFSVSHTAESGESYGGFFRSYSQTGVGIHANAQYIGVSGLATASMGESYGGHFQTDSSVGTAVYGIAYDHGGITYGIAGKVLSPSGYSGHFQGGRFFIEGNTGIGTLYPTSKLEVAGQIKITGGSPGAGKVLTSDGTGLASWQSPGANTWLKNPYGIHYNNGNVGIGQTPYRNKLTIYDDVAPRIGFYNSTSGNSGTDGFSIGTESSGAVWLLNWENSNMHFGTNGERRMDIAADGTVVVWKSLRINSEGASTKAIYVRDYEALWSNGEYFSWGYGCDYNYFANPVTIKSSSVPGYDLVVNGTAAKTGGGNWSNLSDIRLKNVLGNYTKGLNEIMVLQPIRFKYKDGNPRQLSSKEEQIGFIAQEVQKTFPEAVSECADGYLDFNMHAVNVALVNAVKELKSENEELKVRLEKLEGIINGFAQKTE